MAVPRPNGDAPITTREEAAAEALILSREHGYGVRQIREELTARGYPCGKTTAAELVREARAQEPFIDLLDRAEARVDQAERLRSYHQIMIEELRGGRVRGREFVETMLKVEERWAKLGGLDAPKQIEVHDDRPQATPNPGLIAALRESITEHQARTAEIEADMDERGI